MSRDCRETPHERPAMLPPSRGTGYKKYTQCRKRIGGDGVRGGSPGLLNRRIAVHRQFIQHLHLTAWPLDGCTIHFRALAQPKMQTRIVARQIAPPVSNSVELRFPAESDF